MLYFCGKGKHSKLLEKAWDELVPASGEPETLAGKVVWAFGRINYEMGNNGCCNMFEWIEEDSGWYGDDEDEWMNEDNGYLDDEPKEFYQHKFELLASVGIDGEALSKTHKECYNVADCGFSETRWPANDGSAGIDMVGDLVGEWLLANWDKAKEEIK